tara:strand:+ start:67 stop:624 length:558 start_codon:yes stop_codon:yes gene_type:complete
MTIVFNGTNNSINLGGTVFSGNASGLTDAPAGTILQTVIGTNGQSSSSSVNLVSADIDNPTILDSNCKVTITPRQSNSKILLTWSAQIRLSAGCEGYVGVYYSANSDMSSPSLVEKKRGSNITESYRNQDTSNTFWSSWSRVAWDETISNTNTRYYNIGGMNAAGNLYYGDNGVALQIMAQEIAV